MVVLANGFIENGYWYLLENISENMSDMFFRAGYDVHIMTFRPNKILLNRLFDTLTDASFKEIVCNQIPYYRLAQDGQYEALRDIAIVMEEADRTGHLSADLIKTLDEILPETQ